MDGYINTYIQLHVCVCLQTILTTILLNIGYLGLVDSGRCKQKINFKKDYNNSKRMSLFMWNLKEIKEKHWKWKNNHWIYVTITDFPRYCLLKDPAASVSQINFHRGQLLQNVKYNQTCESFLFLFSSKKLLKFPLLKNNF